MIRGIKDFVCAVLSMALSSFPIASYAWPGFFSPSPNLVDYKEAFPSPVVEKKKPLFHGKRLQYTYDQFDRPASIASSTTLIEFVYNTIFDKTPASALVNGTPQSLPLVHASKRAGGFNKDGTWMSLDQETFNELAGEWHDYLGMQECAVCVDMGDLYRWGLAILSGTGLAAILGGAVAIIEGAEAAAIALAIGVTASLGFVLAVTAASGALLGYYVYEEGLWRYFPANL